MGEMRMGEATSFILVKPDALADQEIYQEIMDQIKGYQLSIISQVSLYLTEAQIKSLWTYAATDAVCLELIKRHVAERPVELILLQSDGDTLAATSLIKKQIREKFASSPFQNCLHSPADQSELQKDLTALLEDAPFGEIVDSAVEMSYPRLDQASPEQNRRCGAYLDQLMKRVPLKEAAADFLLLSESFKLFLVDDDFHDAKGTAGVILSVFPDYSREQAYYIAFGTNFLGRFPLWATDDGKRAQQVVAAFADHGMLVAFTSDETF